MNNSTNTETQRIHPESRTDTASKNGVRQGTSEKRDLSQTSDEQATAGQSSDQDRSKENQDGVRRYDEADPNWTEPDVQMQNDRVNPELEANIGPQS